MKWVQTLLTVASVTCLVALGCRDNGPTGVPGFEFSLGIAYTNRGTPQVSVNYGWWDAGNATSVKVVRNSAPGTVVWGIATPGESNIVSPVTHGVVPSGAVLTAAIEDTVAPGVLYRVTVTLLDGRTSLVDFTP